MNSASYKCFFIEVIKMSCYNTQKGDVGNHTGVTLSVFVTQNLVHSILYFYIIELNTYYILYTNDQILYSKF